MTASERNRRELEKRLAAISGEMEKLTKEIAAAERNRRNPLSTAFPSRKPGSESLEIDLARDLESAGTDCELLRAALSADIRPENEKSIREVLPKLREYISLFEEVEAYLKAELAGIERVQRILQ